VGQVGLRGALERGVGQLVEEDVGLTVAARPSEDGADPPMLYRGGGMARRRRVGGQGRARMVSGAKSSSVLESAAVTLVGAVRHRIVARVGTRQRAGMGPGMELRHCLLAPRPPLQHGRSTS
jgi:hypothetical protein